MIAAATSAFERWALENQCYIAHAVSSSHVRIYADSRTQEAFEALSAGEAALARMLTDSTFESEAIRERVRRLAGME